MSAISIALLIALVGIGLGCPAIIAENQKGSLLSTPPAAPASQSRDLVDDFTLTTPTYRDPNSSLIYFEIAIAVPVDSERFAPIPQDWLFLLDASQSITYPRHVEFSKAIKTALDFMPPRDRFNIVALRTRAESAFPDFVSPEPARILQAEAFLQTHHPRGKTDLEAALVHQLTLPVPTVRSRPVSIFLFSDGRMTTGSPLDDHRLLRRIREVNAGRLSISTFSCGGDTHRYLLDLLAYGNGGVNIHQEAIDWSYVAVANYFQSVSELVVADLSVTIAGANAEEVYPRTLPHLYRHRPVRIVGRCPAATQEVSVGLRGQLTNGGEATWESVVNLGQGESADLALAQRWVAHQIYRRWSERQPENTEAIDREVMALARQFHVIVPF